MKKSYISFSSTYTTVVLAIVACSFFFFAYSGGITGQTRKPGSGNGCTCHGASSTAGVNVSISGPDTMFFNTTATFTVKVSGGPLSAAGTNIAVSSGNLTAGVGLQLINAELTHTEPKAPVSGEVVLTFQYRSPNTTGTVTMYANGNSVNLNGSSDGDNWNFATNKSITVMQQIPVELTSFTASSNGSTVTLNWVTATELNNRGFEIERKSSSTEWNKVGFVAGNGTTTSVHNYTFSDENVSGGTYQYRLKQLDHDGSVEIHALKGKVDVGSPVEFALGQNYPNPFNPSTNIAFALPVSGNVRLSVYSITGTEVQTLINGFRAAGSYIEQFAADNLAAGVYFYRLSVTESATGKQTFNTVRKMILNK